jgi:hypothetical protein
VQDFNCVFRQRGGTTETATASINDSTGASLQSVAPNGIVATGPVTTSLSGFTIRISNASKTQYGMDFSITGPYSDTGTGTCTDVVFRKSACTIVLKQDNPGAGEITIHVAPMGTGKSYVFHIPLGWTRRNAGGPGFGGNLYGTPATAALSGFALWAAPSTSVN